MNSHKAYLQSFLFLVLLIINAATASAQTYWQIGCNESYCDFDNQPVDTASPVKRFFIANSSPDVAYITSIGIAGPFEIVATNCYDGPLYIYGECYVDTRFKPLSVDTPIYGVKTGRLYAYADVLATYDDIEFFWYLNTFRQFELSGVAI
jgi:hypothetical protein